MTDIFIEGGRTLVDGALVETSLRTAGRDIGALDAEQGRAALHIDVSGLLVLPGIIDLHGDAFERQMMPRPSVDFPTDVALIDSDRQAIANGITTVFHGTTWSWEPGLRSAENARKLLDAIEALRPQLAADTRFHLRHETHNLEAEAEIIQWLAEGRIDLFAFNDHSNVKPKKRNQLAERTGLSVEAVNDMLDRVVARRPEVPASITRLAAAARAADIRMLSHDDNSPAMRQEFRALGAVIAEFPVNEETARDAADAGDFIVFGAPNVVRGGSHTGWTKASDMIAQGLCSVLASDYYYPAQLLAAFRLAADGILPLARAWDLISSAPARAAGLADRGVLAAGCRADIIVVDDKVPLRPRIVAVIVAGRLVHLADTSCLVHSLAPRKTVAAA
ncbi:alpha-D-ribose 1-methylphosphonate 5-triphosphate diphosphatase [Bradyrhizobium elkanii]|uniref:alpha-D-ribose 1-methylphosphonate 5-triphosphate diphosphatase n=1 Tax=Bradyrhizobium elkanii TaxID=29448 RepID=UPI000841BDE1|nr:alpha-D-ribose 1-methylphosphonate 5-triphosphate diphosphatase [Bradyrhizobium elkanii]ODM75470.1 alpha-D-ribose 1-methylphosphonate 5-triphosphate diphosphatase [Bradyrhizobium elkanii]ODM75964.1 alpha-D-ribose 1-methylphosphonate 5-triphosphate diphosphatase [Bradyrhizobium elkanii]